MKSAGKNSPFLIPHSELFDAALLVDEYGKIYRANDNASRLYCIKRGELFNINYFKLVVDYRRQMSREYFRLLKTGGQHTYESYHVKNNGVVFPVQIKIIKVESGSKTFYYLFISDITERTEEEERLRRVSRAYALLGRVSDALLHYDNPNELFQNLCRLIVEEGNAAAVWFSKINRRTKQMRIIAFYGINRDFYYAGYNNIDYNKLLSTFPCPFTFPLKTEGKVKYAISLCGEIAGGKSAEEKDIFRSLLANIAFALNYYAGRRARLKSEAARKIADARYKELLQSFISRLQESREEERNSLAREIHDDLGQALTAIKYDISFLIKDKAADADAVERLSKIACQLDASLNTVRRVITDLRPAALDQMGFSEAVETLLEQFSARAGIKINYSIPGRLIVEPEKAIQLYRIIQELLNNILKHSGAAEAEVNIAASKNQIRLNVSDNGIGIKDEDLHKKGSYGLTGIKERAASLKGSVEITKLKPGTQITVQV